ncbi:MAG: hypothetical protein KJO35_00560, partial [Gammaproteobacteria bacterium]|nr:hypothetical protein [Gammaproteobacteria bacterium]
FFYRTIVMIKGFSSLDLSSMVGAINRLKSAGPPARSTQPMPGQDTIHSVGSGESEGSVNPATVSTVKERQAVYERPVVVDSVRPGSSSSSPAGEEASDMMDRMRASLFTRSGDEGFDSSVDLNSDGQINFQDMKMLKDQMVSAEPTMMQRMNESFFTREGDEGFDSEVDLNQDGIINFGDMFLLKAKLEAENNDSLQPAPPAGNPPQEMNQQAASPAESLRVDALSASGLEPAPAASVPPQVMNVNTPDSTVELLSAKDEAMNSATRKLNRY